MRQPGEVYWVVPKFHEYWGTSLEDDENSGRPSTTIPLKTAKQLQEFRITIKEVADTVNVSNGLLQALHMIKSTLDMHCLCNQFSPRLSPPSRGSTVLKSAETMSRMITGDKSTGGYNLEKITWQHVFAGADPLGEDPIISKTKLESCEGRAGQELDQNYARRFFRLCEVVHRKNDPQGRTIWLRTFGGNNLNCGVWELDSLT